MTLPDIDTIDNLGGILRNYHPVEDPETDLDADLDNTHRADTAMMTRTAIKSWCHFQPSTTTAGIHLIDHEAQWGNILLVAPTIARLSTGAFEFTYPTTVNDELSVSHALNFRAGWGNSRNTSLMYTIHVSPSAANKLLALIYDSSNVLSDANGGHFDVVGI